MLQLLKKKKVMHKKEKEKYVKERRDEEVLYDVPVLGF